MWGMLLEVRHDPTKTCISRGGLQAAECRKSALALLLLFTTAIYYCYLLLNQLSGDKRLRVGKVFEDATEKRELVY